MLLFIFFLLFIIFVFFTAHTGGAAGSGQVGQDGQRQVGQCVCGGRRGILGGSRCKQRRPQYHVALVVLVHVAGNKNRTAWRARTAFDSTASSHGQVQSGGFCWPVHLVSLPCMGTPRGPRCLRTQAAYRLHQRAHDADVQQRGLVSTGGRPCLSTRARQGRGLR